jgi:hypothetical protein
MKSTFKWLFNEKKKMMCVRRHTYQVLRLHFNAWGECAFASWCEQACVGNGTLYISRKCVHGWGCLWIEIRHVLPPACSANISATRKYVSKREVTAGHTRPRLALSHWPFGWHLYTHEMVKLMDCLNYCTQQLLWLPKKEHTWFLHRVWCTKNEERPFLCTLLTSTLIYSLVGKAHEKPLNVDKSVNSSAGKWKAQSRASLAVQGAFNITKWASHPPPFFLSLWAQNWKSKHKRHPWDSQCNMKRDVHKWVNKLISFWEAI